jgi:hypothetical protein
VPLILLRISQHDAVLVGDDLAFDILREADVIVSAAFGEDRRRELVTAGAAMSMYEMVSRQAVNGS